MSETISDFSFELQWLVEEAGQGQAAAPCTTPGEFDQGPLLWLFKRPSLKNSILWTGTLLFFAFRRSQSHLPGCHPSSHQKCHPLRHWNTPGDKGSHQQSCSSEESTQAALVQKERTCRDLPRNSSKAMAPEKWSSLRHNCKRARKQFI